jgi:hypothetical protein
MLSRFVEARYIEASGAESIHEDRYGQIFRCEMKGDEDLIMVRVLNSTPEPDGTVKMYWLRVQPDLRPMMGGGRFGESQKMSARNAIASTFGLRGEEYAPEQET